ncbi:uncharacterized protein B0P05DRAFT_545901 [Gilbertella persicaria]|uniref:uncharacterized protein n=1 Tax=Gilbertella persicaria TaxID=101096 RepID=UPI00221EF0E9|nr:uncharacterized protein B0P05DRAFT_545901 [Gilbertella persicaria]KAI8076447.1 hypothetical protein B0P05DRAFT_545901 [Gilbertella persicaria]
MQLFPILLTYGLWDIIFFFLFTSCKLLHKRSLHSRHCFILFLFFFYKRAIMNFLVVLYTLLEH